MDRPRSVRLFVSVSLAVAGVRLLVFWFLLAKHWSNTFQLLYLPLLGVLLPEGFLLPNDIPWTARNAVLFSGVLVVGSFVAGGLVMLLGTLIRDSPEE